MLVVKSCLPGVHMRLVVYRVTQGAGAKGREHGAEGMETVGRQVFLPASQETSQIWDSSLET